MFVVIPKWQFWTWGFLASIGRNTAVRYSVIFPFVGHFILFGDKMNQWFFSLNAEYAIALPKFGGFTVYATYYGLILLGVGAFIFALTCPPEIKTSNTAADFASRRNWTDVEMLRAFNWLQTAYGSGQFEFRDLSRLSDSRADYDLILWNPSHNNRDAKYLYYEMKSVVRPVVRFVVLLFYGAGLILTALGALSGFYRITVKLIGG